MNMHPKQKAAFERAKEHEGLKEIVGPQHNQAILDFFRAVGHGWVKDDETAWCAAFVGAMLQEAGLPHTGKLNARSYLEWGQPVNLKDAKPGDVVVFWRGKPDGWQGHVGFYVGMKGKSIRVLGGNQRNEVNVSNYGIDRFLGLRRMPGPAPSADLPEAPASGIFAAIAAILGRIFK